MTRLCALFLCVPFFSCAAPPARLEFPAAGGWSSVTVMKKDGVEEVAVETRFVASGEKFRLEVWAPAGAGMIAVYDGKRLVTTSPREGLTASQLDPRVAYRDLYATLTGYRYLGRERVDGRTCWRFAATLENVEHQMWIDVESHLPRRNYVKRHDAVVDEQFFELPEGFEATPALFDADYLEERLRERAGDRDPPDASRAGPESASAGARA